MNTVNFNGAKITPSKIVCIGRNYVAHIEELGNEVPDDMVVFNKPNSAIGDQLRAQVDGETLHYEAELCFLVLNQQLAAVALGIDLTRRQLQSRLKKAGLPWERAKAFDGAALFSDFVPLPDSLSTLSLELDVDNAPRQRGGVGLMLYPPATIVTEIQRFMSLADGDILMTGTPAGVGEVRAGEHFVGRVLSGSELLLQASWHAV